MTISNKPGPNDVAFTQFLRPNGRRALVWVERSPEVAQQARELVEAGYRFEIEELRTGVVSMTVEPADEEAPPIAHKLGPNGPEVLPLVDELVRDAYQRWKGVTE